jgi:hypothetical protein
VRYPTVNRKWDYIAGDDLEAPDLSAFEEITLDLHMSALGERLGTEDITAKLWCFEEG